MARRAISIFEDGCGAPTPTVCFWLMLVISALPVLRVGPAWLKEAVLVAQAALQVIYKFHCVPTWKALESPSDGIDEFDTQIIEEKDFDRLKANLDEFRAILDKGV